jgi:LPXTG-motif cell wall-anchored protein
MKMYSKTARMALAVLFLVGSATLVRAQSVGGYSNAPTDKDYRMTVLEPQEGATIQGSDVSISLRLPRVPQGDAVNQKERMDALTPTFQIFVDGKSVGNLPAGQNVFTAHDLAAGPHKIAVVAKNTAGEVLDRKEINITTTAATSTMAATGTTSYSAPAPAPAPVAAPPEPAPAPEPVASAPPAPAAVAPSAPATAPATIPQTGSSYPDIAVAGLALLLAGGVLLRRRS